MEESTFHSSFQVGDLVTLKHHPGAPLAVVVSLDAIVFDRIQIEYVRDGSREMIDPRHMKVVSRNASR